MNISDIRTKTDDELKQLLADLSKEALNLRFQKSNGQLSTLSRPAQVRKEVARIQTALRERAMGVSYAAKATKTKKAAAPKKAAKKKAS